MVSLVGLARQADKGTHLDGFFGLQGGSRGAW